MTTPPEPDPEPDHTGLRPLGPYGEGYCRTCHFIEPLNCFGVIAQHYRNTSYQPTECKGSYKSPPKVTPFSSRKAAFTAKGKLVWCPGCRTFVATATMGSVRVYARHMITVGEWCGHSLMAVKI